MWLSRFCAERLQSLIRTLDLHRLDEYASLQKVASFATLVATYEKGQFLIKSKFSPLICHLPRLPPYSWTLWNGQRDCPKSSIPFHVRLSSLRWNWVQASYRCLDPSLAIKPVFERFSSVVITSGTISPLDMYPKMLQFTPVVQETYPMTLTRNAFLPLVSIFFGFLSSPWHSFPRSSQEGVTKWRSVQGSKSETTLPWFATLEAS